MLSPTLFKMSASSSIGYISGFSRIHYEEVNVSWISLPHTLFNMCALSSNGYVSEFSRIQYEGFSDNHGLKSNSNYHAQD